MWPKKGKKRWHKKVDFILFWSIYSVIVRYDYHGLLFKPRKHKNAIFDSYLHLFIDIKIYHIWHLKVDRKSEKYFCSLFWSKIKKPIFNPKNGKKHENSVEQENVDKTFYSVLSFYSFGSIVVQSQDINKLNCLTQFDKHIFIFNSIRCKMIEKKMFFFPLFWILTNVFNILFTNIQDKLNNMNWRGYKMILLVSMVRNMKMDIITWNINSNIKSNKILGNLLQAS